jgi:transcriptional regulator with GAF, ATPase, and Fis domain
VADTPSTVLIQGETGTGKELLANAIHQLSRRNKQPLVKVNCAAIQENLAESELFGHEKGAFTGAFQRKIGRFELADGGTLFLDEIGELPLNLQPKLLRVLQEGEFERLGSTRTIKVDVRLITATNRDLRKMVFEKTFREDLYFRLSVFPITNLPLRDRKDDIPLLVKFFVDKFNQKMGKQVKEVSAEDMAALMEYDFPGNIRELENIIERAIILSKGEELQLTYFLP